MSEPIVGPASEYAAVSTLETSRRRGSLTRSGTAIGSDAILSFLTGGAAFITMLMLAALVAVMAHASMPAIHEFGWKFLVSSEWRPNTLTIPKTDANGNVVIQDGETVTVDIPPAFGALPVMFGSAVSSMLALIFAIPLSLGAALFLVRIAPKWMKGPVSFLVEFLAAIPSIAYGMWGLFVLAPFLQRYVESSLGWLYLHAGRPTIFHWLFQETDVLPSGEKLIRDLPLSGRDMFSGGLVLAVMIVPIITAIARDVLKSVPRAQVEGTIALGATWWQTSKEMLRYSRAGLFGAVMLGLARAAGETMAVTMVIGNNNQIRASLFAPAQTMSSLLANEFAEASTDIHRSALSEVALILLVMSLLFNIVARYLVVGRGSRTAAAH